MRYRWIIVSLLGIACEEEEKPSIVMEEEITRNYMTQNYFGSATVAPGESYEGTHVYQFAQSAEAGLGVAVVELIWNVTGTPEAAPESCVGCAFAFELQLVFDEEASTDLENQGYDMAFSYALGSSEYGENTLFYGYNDSWGIWIVDGREQIDDEGTAHLESVYFSGSEFTYTDGVIDFYEAD